MVFGLASSSFADVVVRYVVDFMVTYGGHRRFDSSVPLFTQTGKRFVLSPRGTGTEYGRTVP